MNLKRSKTYIGLREIQLPSAIIPTETNVKGETHHIRMEEANFYY